MVLLLLLTSCVEKFNLQLDNSQKLIVEGVISNKPGPYLFHLTLSTSNFDTTWQSKDINDTTAILTLSDDNGTTDTLKLLNTRYQVHPKWGYSFVVIPNYSGTFDTIRVLGIEGQKLKGIYYSTFISGQVGREYTLRINYKNETYFAKDYLNPGPIIDSLSFHSKSTDKIGDFFVPSIYFKKPKNDINYYLFDFSPNDLYSLLVGAGGNWFFSILIDEFLPNYINGYQINDGPSPKILADFSYVQKGDRFKLRLSSLSKEAYKYYQSLIAQFNNDGGVFTPIPASAPTNLSNGALGYFRASAISEVIAIVK